jgi:hypothetical protein
LNDGNQAEWHQAGVQVVRLFMFLLFYFCLFHFSDTFFSWPSFPGGFIESDAGGISKAIRTVKETNRKESRVFLCPYLARGKQVT